MATKAFSEFLYEQSIRDHRFARPYDCIGDSKLARLQYTACTATSSLAFPLPSAFELV